jgi:hypothetical protein
LQVRWLRTAFLAAVRAEAAYFSTRNRDFDAAIMGDLAFQFLVQLAFELANLSTSHASDVNMIARAVTLVKMTVAAEVQKIQLIYQSVALQQVNRAIHGDACDSRINFLSAFEDFVGVKVPPGSLHHLQKYAPLARESDSARTQFMLKPSGRFVINALSGRYAMCRRGRHGSS